MENIKKQIINTIAHYGASNARISSRQYMKLKEWILPYLIGECGLGDPGIISIEKMRKFIDSWEADDLNEKDYKYYYVDKDSNGKSFWDFLRM